MKKYLSVALLVVLFISTGCNKNMKRERESRRLDLTEAQRLQAQTIVHDVCENCHHPTAAPDDRLAPPLEVAKRNYLKSSSGKREFVSQLTNFIKAPSEEKAKLHSDVDEFGIMDPLGYSEEEIRSVAIFIYETDLEKPDWLE